MLAPIPAKWPREFRTPAMLLAELETLGYSAGEIREAVEYVIRMREEQRRIVMAADRKVAEAFNGD